jgi:RNA polymerase sigma-70 factor (ECF subfamily)
MEDVTAPSSFVPNFEASFTTLKPKLCAFVMKIIGNWHDTEEVVQETFISALQKSSTFRGKHERVFETWLFKIAFNCALNLKRKKKRLARNIEEGFFIHEKTRREIGRKLLLTQEIDHDLTHFISCTVPGVSPRMHQAFVLFEVEGFTYSEISLVFGVHKNTVKSWVWRTRRKIQKEALRVTPLQ